MLLAEVYAADVNVTQYWASEKFDGVRAQWNGRSLRFRGSGIVPAPAWFTANFPAVPLDGELWIGRDQFDALSGTVRKVEPLDAEWRQVRYLIFELPGRRAASLIGLRRCSNSSRRRSCPGCRPSDKRAWPIARR